MDKRILNKSCEDCIRTGGDLECDHIHCHKGQLDYMNEKESFQIVLNKLKECNLFCGFYDARNGSNDFMDGIYTVMEVIAYYAEDEMFSDMFLKNMVISRVKYNVSDY